MHWTHSLVRFLFLLFLLSPATARAQASPLHPKVLEAVKACHEDYKTFRDTWEPSEAKAREALEAAESQPLEKALVTLTTAYRNVEAARKPFRNVNQGWHDYIGNSTLGEIVFAILRAELAAKRFSRSPYLSPDRYRSVTPVTGDAVFDEAAFCVKVLDVGSKAVPNVGHMLSSSKRDVPQWQSAAEIKTFAAKRDKLHKAGQELLKSFEKARAEAPRSGFVGVVKKMTKSKGKDGITTFQLAYVDGGYVCRHTGDYRWTGTVWSDCTYENLPPKELYRFKATFDGDVSSIKVGDSIAGLCKRAVDSDNKSDAEISFLNRIERKGKIVYTAGLEFELDR